ncbi:HlyD family type I secretion periplasmic adaptor subunit [Ramlibacter algicola]|uniref:Membrane fusion protein (MFP) family protein n=1 Tax=Ramlibacter algicola TaxID=2795217 RepID=A0A934Q096_9BURK|nr:HlyD family type I secretion periplasmic adaptor subunit [Ramlibacter algicola]MBK0392416.1 HlyD family type I secretion periplasmic adaptor subunit [Ramlibacter algicola]
MSAAVLDGGQDPILAPQFDEARRLARRGSLVLALGLLPLLGWLAFAPLSSAVIAQAHVKVDLDRRSVQHAEGGIVREVKVRDGQRVKQGEPLLVLGDVGVDADVNRLGLRQFTEQAGIARLEAEQAGAGTPVFPADLVQAGTTDSRVAEQIVKERALFNARRDALRGQTALLRSQGDKISREIASLKAQIEQARSSMGHQRAELERNRQLLKDGFISGARISQLEATVADYGVKLEERHSELARAEQRMVDVELRLKGLESDYRQQASDQLKVAAVRLSEIQQELRKSTDASRRQVIVAPVAGEVMNLRYPSPGSVISPREPVADIVPADPRLVVEAQIRPEDINRVRHGQVARMRLTAFNTLTTPMVEGKVFYVSADRNVDRTTQQPYYVVLVEADPASLQEAGRLTLQAGMPAEVFIRGEDRTPLQYLLEPVTLLLSRAGRER